MTAAASLFTVRTPAVMQAVFGNQILLIGLIIVELGLVIGLSAAINRLSAGTATLLFLAYSALNGVTLSVIFVTYSQAAILKAFFVSGGMTPMSLWKDRFVNLSDRDFAASLALA